MLGEFSVTLKFGSRYMNLLYLFWSRLSWLFQEHSCDTAVLRGTISSSPAWAVLVASPLSSVSHA